VEPYVVDEPSRQVALLRGVDLVDHDHVGPPQVDLAGEVRQFMARAVRVDDHDFQVGGIERSVVVAAVPSE
jgi:hypothetical protein